ncbi:MAG: transposase [Acidobacteriota bacterium]
MTLRRRSGCAFLVTLWTYGGRPIFARPDTARLFCRTLGHLRHRLGFRLHAYVVLPDRVRMILGAPEEDPYWIQVAVQRLKSRFAREANARSGRPGLVWQDADQRVALATRDDVARRADLLHRYPVMSRLARHPADWRWSSFRAWAGRGRSPAPVDLPEAADLRARVRAAVSTRPSG